MLFTWCIYSILHCDAGSLRPGSFGEGGLLGLKQILVLEMTDFRSVVCTLCICDVVFKCNFVFGTPKFKENLQEEI